MHSQSTSLLKYIEYTPKKCPYCGKGFQSSKWLPRHIHLEHPELPRFCLKCGTKLDEEIKRHHLCQKCKNALVNDKPCRRTRWYREEKYRENLRFKILRELGGRCVQCGETDWRCLQVDHIDSDGYKERKRNKKQGRSSNGQIIRNIVKGNHRYQLLCANCNSRKKYEKRECRGRKPWKTK